MHNMLPVCKLCTLADLAKAFLLLSWVNAKFSVFGTLKKILSASLVTLVVGRIQTDCTFSTVLICFSGLTLAALQLRKSPAAVQFDNAAEPFVCGDAQPLVCDADLPVANISASTQQQQAPWTSQDSCVGGCIYVSYKALSRKGGTPLAAPRLHNPRL